MNRKHDLNSNEQAVLSYFERTRSAAHLTTVQSAVFGSVSSDYTSWTRNSIRKLVSTGFLVKVARGTYALTAKAQDAQALKDQRDARGWSQYKVARDAHLRRGRVSHLETGRRTARPSELFALAGVLETPVTELVQA